MASHSTQKLQEEEEDEQVTETAWQVATSCRWTLAYVGFICCTILYALRVNMGVAIVCMVKPANVSNAQKSIPKECMAPVTNFTSAHQEVGGDIEWDKDLQGWVLSSFFYGYIVTQIPGGYLSGRFGGKRVLLVGYIINGLVTILTPLAARYDGKNYTTSAGLVIALRVIAGLSTGVVFPAIQSLLGHWSPPYERSKLNVLCFSGTMAGNVLMLGVGGFFCEWEAFDGGWPSMFYVGGGICLLFCFVWHFFIFDSPNEHPRISEREKLYIAKSLDGSSIQKNDNVPWLDMAKSPALWAIIVVHFANNFGNYTLVTKLPAFMKEVLHFDIKSNGLYSTLPYIAGFIVANSASHVIDIMRRKHIVTTKTARKTAMLLALLIPAAALVAAGHVPCDKSYLGVMFLVIAVGFMGFNRSGYVTNAQDIAPKYAGEIYGISNTFATIPGMVAPNLVNALTPTGSTAEWQMVFYIWAAIFVIGAIFYTIFARGEVETWAEEPPADDPQEKESDSESSKEKITEL
ncbi:sialin-like [Watersipora subatra]|uniref:sialin-like n=1 Tax=Watersipora subatra TaxID=2589382 RepID=UPI00355C03C8